MSRSFRVDDDFFDDLLDEAPFVTHRRKREDHRIRRSRQNVRPVTEVSTPHDSPEGRMMASWVSSLEDFI
jgi:hypothetical protein